MYRFSSGKNVLERIKRAATYHPKYLKRNCRKTASPGLAGLEAGRWRQQPGYSPEGTGVRRMKRALVGKEKVFVLTSEKRIPGPAAGPFSEGHLKGGSFPPCKSFSNLSKKKLKGFPFVLLVFIPALPFYRREKDPPLPFPKEKF